MTFVFVIEIPVNINSKSLKHKALFMPVINTIISSNNQSSKTYYNMTNLFDYLLITTLYTVLYYLM